jgi:endonuclease III
MALRRNNLKQEISANNGRATLTPSAPVQLRANYILNTLQRLYPSRTPALRYVNRLQLLISAILSAQTTDAQVNALTPALFARYRTAEDFAGANIRELESMIHSAGFYHAKAKAIRESCRRIIEVYGGEVPGTMEELMTLRGVARKVSNVVLWHGFGRNEGFTVDTHVRRLAQLLGLSKFDDPTRIERDLMQLFPRENWNLVAHQIIAHGRAICIARRPRCESCALFSACPSRKFPL